MAAITQAINRVTNLEADIAPTFDSAEINTVRRLLESSTFSFRFSASEHPARIPADYSIVTKPLTNSRNAFIGLLMVFTLWYGELSVKALHRLVSLFDRMNQTRFLRFLEQA